MLKNATFIFLLLFSGIAITGSHLDELKKVLTRVIPGISVDKLKPSRVPGLYEATVGGDIFYITKDGRYIISGTIIDTNSHENITANRRNKLRIDLIKAVGESNMIIFSPPRPKRVITVFTDVDCAYCAKFHLGVPKLTRAGVKVRYLLFPRNGLSSSTYTKSVTVWCARDRRKALGFAKAGKKLKPRTCTNPVADHYRLGTQIGVRGTPTIVLENGRMLPGYVPPEDLLVLLGLRKGKK